MGNYVAELTLHGFLLMLTRHGFRLISAQALDMPFSLLAASDVCASYREFVHMNYSGNLEHMFSSVEEQIRPGSVCELCAAKRCEEELLCSPPTCHDYERCEVDLLVSGTPCNPFSKMRTKRFADGMLKEHSLFDVTMTSAIALYTRVEPKRGIFEQVWGFCQPVQSGTTETPKDRRDSSGSAVRVRVGRDFG